MTHHAASKLQTRIAEQKEAIEAFARLHREMAALRGSLALPEAAERVEALLNANADALRAMNEDLAVSLALLRGPCGPVACVVGSG